jgi:predicted GNAT superfamily acetyltransferase
MTSPTLENTPYVIRRLESPDDYRAFEGLQKEVWGGNIAEVITPAMAAIVQKIGGIAAGAFDEDGQMVGLVFGFTGYREGLLVHWSHMLAVKEGIRNSGVGRQLKLYQREELLKLGVDEVYWTFDPLVARNAFFNFNRLGVSPEEYAVDMYGPGDDSELFRGLGTDRLVVIWRIAKEYIKSAIEGRLRFDSRPYANVPMVVSREVEGDPTSPPVLRKDVHEERIRIEIPPDIHLVRDTLGSAALAWRKMTRDAFQSAFSERYEISGFYRDESSQRCFYCLQKRF